MLKFINGLMKTVLSVFQTQSPMKLKLFPKLSNYRWKQSNMIKKNQIHLTLIDLIFMTVFPGILFIVFLILDLQVFMSWGDEKVVAESGNILGIPRMRKPSS